ncbi:N-methyl-L-tryptophan oxidase [soil metagenome]
MATDVECAVIGAGMAGTAASRALARAGAEVVVFEQFHLGHGRGSSHGASRIFRFSYHDPFYVRMAMGALPLWRELEEEMGRELVTTTGGLDAGKRLDDHVAALTECGADFEVLDGRRARERFPRVTLPDDERVLFQPDAGIAHAEAAVRAFADSATSHGAELNEGSPVTRLKQSSGHVEIDVEGETYRAKVAVVTAGAWARPLLAEAGIDLPVTPTRETVAYFRIEDELSVPSLVDWSDPVFYALASPGEGLKAGWHHTGPPTDPGAEGIVDRAAVERLSERVAERFPSADPDAHHAETCIYTNTSDEHLIVERRGDIVIGSACSGHGFKFAPLTGKRIAELALGGAR